MRHHSKFFIFALLLTLACASACAGPCERLANNICDCEADANSILACKSQITTDSPNLKPTAVDNKFCEQKLKTCSCSALRSGDRAACGFTRE